MEILIALGILALVLTALLKLQMKSIQLTWISRQGLKTLVVAVNQLEKLLEERFSGEKEEEKDGFMIKAKTQTLQELQTLERLQVEVTKDDFPPQEFSVYRMK